MSLMKVALLQMVSCGNDQDANLSKGMNFCRRAHDMGADVALFPEMWNIGYTSYDAEKPNAREIWQAQAIGVNDRFILEFQRLARELGMAIAVTYLEAQQGPPRNVVSIVNRHGHIVMTYAKVHTCDFGAREASCTPGSDFYVCDVDTGGGIVKVGAMICYDREAPESARILMFKGTELILTPNACGLDRLRIDQFKTRAYENAVGVAMTNYASPQHNGHSVAYDADGSLILEAGEREGIYLATFDLEKLRAHRKKTIWGNAFRRPHRYGLLTSLDVAAPFVRKNAFDQPFNRVER